MPLRLCVGIVRRVPAMLALVPLLLIAQPSYRILPVGVQGPLPSFFPFTPQFKFRINGRGQVAGAYSTDTSVHAFLWQATEDGSSGTLKDLGTLPPPYNAASGATGINNRGDVVGYSTSSTGLSHAFLWDKGVMVDLGTARAPYDASCYATAINDNGEVAGACFRGDVFGGHAVLWDPAGSRAGTNITDLGTLPAPYNSFGVATAINNRGQVVGYSSLNPSFAFDELWGEDLFSLPHAFLWNRDGMQDLGTLPASSPNPAEPPMSVALDINNSGEVVGYSGAGATKKGFIWKDGAMTPISSDARWTLATAINDAGQVAGEFGITTLGSVDAFLWQRTGETDAGVITDLGIHPSSPSAYTLIPGTGTFVSSYTVASGINNRGQIVGGSSGPGIILWNPVH